MSVSLVLLVLALVFLVASALGKIPLWPAVLCVVLERLIPLSR